jgi:hypothetical protein
VLVCVTGCDGVMHRVCVSSDVECDTYLMGRYQGC